MLAERFFDFRCPTIAYAPGGASALGNRIKDLGGKRVLLCSDGGIQKTGILELIRASLENAGLAVTCFFDIDSNPTIETVDRGYEHLLAGQSDSVLAVGGGSVIDAAKAIALLGTNPPPLSRYFGIGLASRPSLPLVAVPTTAGTGSEVTWVAVISDTRVRKKLSIVGPGVIPDLSLLDPTLLATLPRKVIAESGLDALSHAVEAFISCFSSPISDGMALESMRLIAGSLKRFFEKSSDMEAAGSMLLASSMAGIAFGNARTATAHAMAHALGGFYNMGHGISCAVVLPVTLEFVRETVPERLVQIAAALGEKTDCLSADLAAGKAIQMIASLSEQLGIPKGLKALGVKREDLAVLSEHAMATGLQAASPREVGLAEMRSLFEKAWNG